MKKELEKQLIEKDTRIQEVEGKLKEKQEDYDCAIKRIVKLEDELKGYESKKPLTVERIQEIILLNVYFNRTDGIMIGYDKAAQQIHSKMTLPESKNVPSEEIKTLCGFCNQPIHIDGFGGVSKENGFFHDKCFLLDSANKRIQEVEGKLKEANETISSISQLMTPIKCNCKRSTETSSATVTCNGKCKY